MIHGVEEPDAIYNRIDKVVKRFPPLLWPICVTPNRQEGCAIITQWAEAKHPNSYGDPEWDGARDRNCWGQSVHICSHSVRRSLWTGDWDMYAPHDLEHAQLEWELFELIVRWLYRVATTRTDGVGREGQPC